METKQITIPVSGYLTLEVPVDSQYDDFEDQIQDTLGDVNFEATVDEDRGHVVSFEQFNWDVEEMTTTMATTVDLCTCQVGDILIDKKGLKYTYVEKVDDDNHRLKLPNEFPLDGSIQTWNRKGEYPMDVYGDGNANIVEIIRRDPLPDKYHFHCNHCGKVHKLDGYATAQLASNIVIIHTCDHCNGTNDLYPKMLKD